MKKKDKDFLIKFGKRIRQARESKFWHIGYTANKIGVSWNTLFNYEKGAQNIPFITALKLLKALNIQHREVKKLFTEK